MIVDNACAPDPRVLKETDALAQGGYDVTILAWDRLGQYAAKTELPRGVIKRLAVRSRHQRRFGQLLPMVRFWWAVIGLGIRERFDVVHSHDLPALPPGVVLSILRRRPLIYDAHEIYWLQDGDKFPTYFRKLLKAVEIVLMQVARNVIAVSEPCADYFRRYHRHVTVIGNWYDPRTISPETRSSCRRSLGVAETEFCLVNIGTLAPFRLVRLLLESAERDPRLQIVLAGRGALEGEIAFASKTLPNVHYLGWIEDPYAVYAAADAIFYGLASEDPYSVISSPNALFQAISLAIPLITSRTGEAGRVIASHGGGVVLSENSPRCLLEAVAVMRSEPANRTARESLRHLQSMYSWERGAEALVGLYAG